MDAPRLLLAAMLVGGAVLVGIATPAAAATCPTSYLTSNPYLTSVSRDATNWHKFGPAPDSNSVVVESFDGTANVGVYRLSSGSCSLACAGAAFPGLVFICPLLSGTYFTKVTYGWSLTNFVTYVAYFGG
ncbi:MAG: hypothetical protein ACT4PT_08895 [Methanobacteriota archaeon]